jgi:hypothetical protein
MSNNEFIINRRPNWLAYPAKYLDLIINEKHEFFSWHLIVYEKNYLTEKSLKKRYPARKLFCFAKLVSMGFGR